MLSGYKTYIAAAACVILAAIEIAGITIPGVTSAPGDLFIAALGLFGLRSAIK